MNAIKAEDILPTLDRLSQIRHHEVSPETIEKLSRVKISLVERKVPWPTVFKEEDPMEILREVSESDEIEIPMAATEKNGDQTLGVAICVQYNIIVADLRRAIHQEHALAVAA